MSSRPETPQTESSTNIKPKVSVDDDDVFTVDFTGKEDCFWINSTEWIWILPSKNYEITFTRGINKHLCNMMQHFDRPPGVKLASLRITEEKVILVFGHDTKTNAFNMFNMYTDVRQSVLTFLQKVKVHVEDVRVRVRLTGTSHSTRQRHQEYKCLFDSMSDHPEGEKSETKWFCMPNTPNPVVDNETSNSRFSRLKQDMIHFAGACLSRVTTGSVIFTFHHGSTENALEMISKHEEVRAMILECLREIDSTVKDIQMEVQLQDFIDPRSLPGHGDRDKRYVDKQEYDKVVQDLSEQVATLKEQLQEMKEKERVQLTDTRLSMWKTRPGSLQPSESSVFLSATDTMTEVVNEDDTDLSEPEGAHRQTGDASKQQHTSGTVTDLRRQLADMRQELKATTESMQRLEISHSKATSKDARKSLTPSRPDTRATPTPASRDARTVTDLRNACFEGKLVEVKRILDTGRTDVNSRVGGGMTPVMWAARGGHRDVVELLVSRGADVSLVDVYCNNILHVACVGGDRETVVFVLSLDGVDVNARNSDGQTATDVARDWGHRQLSDLLVSRGIQCCVM
ncbi:uncharacterized protein [Haliotis asinina]|uniref:uncharacterized protein n=1 Tax=Haliotis asinina TaxID=109174 RepID=UPI0035325B13